MKLLLDTHVLIWWDAGMPLSAAANHAILHADDVFVSAASAWEVGIKQALGKLATTRSVAVAAESSGFAELPVLFRHADALPSLPAHHRDPFDRLLVAQARVEGLTLVTRDRAFAAYDVDVIEA